MLAGIPAAAGATTFTVTSSADAGPDSLRAAIGLANAAVGPDAIAFSIDSGPKTISLTSALPAITDAVTIDGTSQPGFSADPLITLDGISAGAGANGLSVAGGDGTVIRGLAIGNFATAAGVAVGTGGTTIVGNWVGVDTDSDVMPNGTGVTVLSGATATVGGTTAADRNVIAGNLAEGVSLNAESASATIVGNLIGVTPTVNRGNGVGVLVNGVAAHALVGTSGPRNVISANGTGVLVASTSTATIQNNVVGLRPDGLTPAGNVGTGVSIGGGAVVEVHGNVISENTIGAQLDGKVTAFTGNLVGTDDSGAIGRGNVIGVQLLSTGTRIGGTTPAARNVISANDTGVDVTASADDATITGNYIGVGASGSVLLGSTVRGISVQGGATGVTIGGLLSPAQQATHACDGPCNVVSGASGNTDAGILVAPNANGTTIQGNAIGTRADGSILTPTNHFANATGISVAAANATIGGFGADASPAGRNVIAGRLALNPNTTVGISTANTTTGLAILGNHVGVLGDGTTPATLATGIKLAGSGSNLRLGDTLTPAALATPACDGACNLVAASIIDDVNLGGSSVAMRGNRIGTNNAGTAAVGAAAAADGVQAGGTHVIGGPSAGDRNLISGHAGGAGIRVAGAGVTIEGNDIGTAAGGDAGTPALRNDVGVFVEGGTGTVVGGAVPDASVGGACDDVCNVISNNFAAGIVTGGSATATIAGNHVGVTRSGGSGLGNTVAGVSHRSTSAIKLGGITPHSRNVISANEGSGIETSSAGTGPLTVQGNLLGTAANGTAPAPNGGAGIHVATRASIGGPGAAGNRIAHNTGDGVFVAPEATGATTVLENEIFANGQLGIDLGVADEPQPGITPNDPGDSDPGGNGLQNFPVLSGATRGFDGTLQVRGALDSAAGAYTLRVYAVGACDATGHGEADRFVGSAAVAAGPGFSATVPLAGEPPQPGEKLAATVTDAGGRTSELSTCVTPRNGVRLANGTYAVAETGGVASITVQRADDQGAESVRVDTVAGGTAAAGADYTATQQVVHFGPGETSKPAAIPVHDDALLEDPETVELRLTMPSAGLELGSPPLRDAAVLTIASDELPAFRLAAESALVGEASPTHELTITRSGGVGASAVRVRTIDGSATAYLDFTPIDQVVRFRAGETARALSLSIGQDANDEPDEALTVELSSPEAATLGTPASTVLTIADDDVLAAPLGSTGIRPPSASPPATSAPQVRRRPPDSRLDRLARTIASSRLRSLTGTASDPDGDLAQVDVALVGVAGGARAAAVRRSCLHFAQTGRVTRRAAASNRRCSPRTWLRATGRERWRLRLPRRLPPGLWTVYVRATDATGARETTFDVTDGNRATVRIRRR